MRGNESAALTLSMAAVLCDRLDGLVARRLKQSSDFGRQLDSLADAVSSLMAPAVTVAVLSAGDPIVVTASGLFVLAGIWRLAHFNLTGEGSVFRGLPTTHAVGGFILLWAICRLGFAAHTTTVLAVFLLAMAPLMLSSIPVQKNGLLTKSLQLLLLPTLVAAWWPV